MTTGLPPDAEDADPLGSLDEIATLVETERQRQAHAFDALDTKAGVIIGFAAATSALAERGGPLLLPGVVLAAAAAVFAVVAFRLQPPTTLDPTRLRRDYLGRPDIVTRFDLVMHKTATMEAADRVFRAKLFWFRAALWALLAAVILLATGTLITSLTSPGGTP